MHPLAAGFWGVFFGTAMLMLVASLATYARSRHNVTLRAALVAFLSALFAAAYLGALPLPSPESEDRVLAHVAALSFASLVMLLLALLGVTQRRRASAVVVGLALVVVLVGWTLQPHQALALSSFVTIAVGLTAVAITVRSALRGDRLAWLAFAGMFFVNVALVGLTWIVLVDLHDWRVHAVSAVAGTAYLSAFSAAMWGRYSYLIELRRVMSYGPSYDPVTRMRSHAETGQLVGAVFGAADADAEPGPVGVVAVSIGNLYALEQLHGRGAVNHALFICASRLRRSVPADVEMGRLGDDGFLLLTRNSDDPVRLVALARQVAQRLAKPVSLNTSDPTAPDSSRASWVADVGVGVLAAATPATRPSNAVTMARAMSRAAWSFSSRIAWFDRSTRQIAELPLTDGAL